MRSRCFPRTLALLVLCLLVASIGVTTVASNKKVEITYLSAGTAAVEQEQNEKWVAEFNRTNPDIHVKYEVVSWADLPKKIMAYAAAGEPPDVAWYGTNQINDWYHMGLLEPLDEWLGESKYEYFPFILSEDSSIVYDGKLYGAPFTLCGLALVARIDHLKEAGIDPQSIKTWDDFIDACQKTTKKPDQYGTLFSLGETRLTSHQAAGFWPANGLRNIVDFRDEVKDNYIELLRVLQDLVDYMPEAQMSWVHKDNIAAYATGTVSLFSTGSYFQGDLKPVAPEIMSPEKTIVLPMPHGEDASESVTTTYTVGYVMFKDSKHKKEAAEFIRFMTQPKVLAEWPMNLAPKSNVSLEDRVQAIGEEARWWQEAWLDLLENTKVVGLTPYSPSEEIEKIFSDELIKLFRKEVTPEQAYDSLRAKITKIIIE